MTKRDTQRLVRRALRQMKMSPEAFAARYAGGLYGASARTVRRWADGEAVPHGAVVMWLRTQFPAAL